MEDIDARVLILDERNWILLVHDPGGPKDLLNGKSFNKPPGWGMSGGRSEPEDEDETDTARREAKEETGLEVEVNSRVESRRQKDGYTKVAFIGYPVAGEIKINTAEIDDCRWFPQRIIYDEKFEMYPQHRTMAQELLRKLRR